MVFGDLTNLTQDGFAILIKPSANYCGVRIYCVNPP